MLHIRNCYIITCQYMKLINIQWECISIVMLWVYHTATATVSAFMCEQMVFLICSCVSAPIVSFITMMQGIRMSFEIKYYFPITNWEFIFDKQFYLLLSLMFSGIFNKQRQLLLLLECCSDLYHGIYLISMQVFKIFQFRYFPGAYLK